MEKTTIINLDVPQIVRNIVSSIEKEREREIVSRRFGLEDKRETLEEIGQLLGITRERVRQIEKQVLLKLSQVKHPQLEKVAGSFKEYVHDLGDVTRVSDLVEKLGITHPRAEAHVSFLAQLLPDVELIPDNDDFYQSVTIKQMFTFDKLENLVKDLVETVKGLKSPRTVEQIHKHFNKDLTARQAEAVLRVSKHFAYLDNKWGLASWPLVNPKSIRDKIYVILKRAEKPLHFGEIAEAIKASDFKRREVTTQAIHNELIKDERFVLVGRGIYALAEWGYTKGTVADIIEQILDQESPLHRDEIIKRVLDQRHVKPTTIILNLQGKKQFKRVAKATYALAK